MITDIYMVSIFLFVSHITTTTQFQYICTRFSPFFQKITEVTTRLQIHKYLSRKQIWAVHHPVMAITFNSEFAQIVS